MKPNFALSLSFDGISLFQRVQGGWAQMNEVALDAADLGAAMASLRAEADAIAPDGGMVKVLLPNDQIKYLSIPDPSPAPDKRLDAVKAALDGATPYAVQDLAFDWIPSNGQIKIAAVALETLTEAEGFTISHHFDPVCFVARAEEGDFIGEVFFGAAEAWIARGGPKPERDTAAVKIVDMPVAPSAEDIQPEEEAAQNGKPQDEPLDDSAQNENSSVAEVTDDPVPAPAFSSIRRASPSKAPAPSPRNENERPAAPEPRLKLGAAKKPTVAQPPKPEAFLDKPKTEAVSPKLGGVTAPELPKDPPKRKAKKPKPEGKGKRSGFFGSRRKAPKPPQPMAGKPKPKDQTPIPPAVAARLEQAKAVDAAHGDAAPAPVAGRPNKHQAPVLTQTAEERQRMSIFGTRDAQAARIGGKPKFLGLILTTALLLILAGVAAWASVFLDDGLARFFPRDQEETAVAGLPDLPAIDTETPVQPVTEAPVEVAALEPDPGQVTATDAIAAVDAPLAPREPSESEAEATYAATGIWPRSPDAPTLPGLEATVGFSEASIDPDVLQVDAVALPTVALLAPDGGIAKQASPAARGTTFDLDERGLVRATLEGAVNPDGVRIFSGRPPVVAPLRPSGADAVASEAVAKAVLEAQLSAIRPRVRPGALVEESERAQLQGLSRAELGRLRPLARPISETEKQDDASLQATRFAVASSLKPLTRPKNFAAVVDNAEDVKVAALQAPIQPKIPSTASVAKQATVKNAISLSRVNLIGVYGKPDSRRALVRLANGRYKKVQVGDTLDGGKVAAIGETQLRYVKKGRNLVLEMPKS